MVSQMSDKYDRKNAGSEKLKFEAEHVISYFKMKDEEFICFSKEQRNKINQLKKSILEKIG